jgi:hypothetical protein
MGQNDPKWASSLRAYLAQNGRIILEEKSPKNFLKNSPAPQKIAKMAKNRKL